MFLLILRRQLPKMSRPISEHALDFCRRTTQILLIAWLLMLFTVSAYAVQCPPNFCIYVVFGLLDERVINGFCAICVRSCMCVLCICNVTLRFLGFSLNSAGSRSIMFLKSSFSLGCIVYCIGRNVGRNPHVNFTEIRMPTIL